MSIDGENNEFKPKFQLTMTWQDDFLKFSQLKENHEILLVSSERDSIWTPIVLFDDVHQYARYTTGRFIKPYRDPVYDALDLGKVL